MHEDDHPFGESFDPRQQNIVLLDDLQKARLNDPYDNGGEGKSKGKGRKDEVQTGVVKSPEIESQKAIHQEKSGNGL